MNEHDLTQLIRDEANALPVSPPAPEQMIVSGRRTRRNRGVLAVAAVTIAVVGIGAAVQHGGTDSNSGPTVSGPTEVGPTDGGGPSDAETEATLNVGTWLPEAAHQDHVKGAITVAANGCVHLRPFTGSEAVVDLVWPQGFTVRQVPRGGEDSYWIFDASGNKALILTLVNLHGEFRAAPAELACDSADDLGGGQPKVFDVYAWKYAQAPDSVG